MGCQMLQGYEILSLRQAFPYDVESWLWWTHLLNSSFDNGTGYFDNDNGQTLFFEGILMDIMVDNGEIWWNFSVSLLYEHRKAVLI